MADVKAQTKAAKHDVEGEKVEYLTSASASPGLPSAEPEFNASSSTPEAEAASTTEAEASTSAGAQGAEAEASPSATDATPSKTTWQAIFSPQYNAYYFYNTETQETTWTNPLEPEASSSAPDASASASASTSATTPDDGASPEPEPESEPQPHPTSGYTTLQAAALAQGIDPSLAYLDPTLASSVPGSSRTAASGALPSFTAKFNARTGQFMPTAARDPSHLSEYERAKRMSEAYFDVDAWQKELAERGGSLKGDAEEEGDGRKRKRPTKKDLERFKEQKKMKKIAKTAWLRT